MSAAPQLEAVRSLVDDPDPKIAALARAVASLAVQSPPVVRRLGIAEVEARVGVDRSTLYRWYQSSRFPRPFYSGSLRTWSESDIFTWEQKQQQVPRRGARGIAAIKRGQTDGNPQNSDRNPEEGVQRQLEQAGRAPKAGSRSAGGARSHLLEAESGDTDPAEARPVTARRGRRTVAGGVHHDS